MNDQLIEQIDAFLRKANVNTYANAGASKADPLRPGSSDYHFEDGDYVYHDTYFGATKFIGEEIVYQKSAPIWGMNYYGFTINSDMSESLFDSILRPALMSGCGDNIPVRGPKEFINGEWKYTFNTEGGLDSFTGIEEISRNGQAVCRLYCHGGLIEHK